MPPRKIEKFPLIYSLAEGILIDELTEKEGEKKSQSSKCAQEFLAYLKSIQFERNYDQAKKANEAINIYYSSDKDKHRSEEYMRNLLQALSFNLTPDQACEVFPKAMMADIPNKEVEKKTGKLAYEQTYKILNEQEPMPVEE